jgi:hypothetical protein
MSRITLFEEHSGSDLFRIEATIEDGALKVIGYDEGPAVETLYGVREHRFAYRFTPERTRFLHYRLRSDFLADDDLLTLMQKLFSGSQGQRKLRDYCHSHNIIYEYDDPLNLVDTDEPVETDEADEAAKPAENT